MRVASSLPWPNYMLRFSRDIHQCCSRAMGLMSRIYRSRLFDDCTSAVTLGVNMNDIMRLKPAGKGRRVALGVNGAAVIVRGRSEIHFLTELARAAE